MVKQMLKFVFPSENPESFSCSPENKAKFNLITIKTLCGSQQLFIDLILVYTASR